MSGPKHQLAFDIHRQPDETTCGPTCLAAVYRYWEDELPLQQVIDEVPVVEGGGTLAVMLGCHALERGYDVHLETFNLSVFDPTWFDEHGEAASAPLAVHLSQQASRRNQDAKLLLATVHYQRFLQLGGKLGMHDLGRSLVRKPLVRGVPVLAGLSSTFLYREARQDAALVDDPYGGAPQGHFVVLAGYDRQTREVDVADPWFPNPHSQTGRYRAGIDRVLSSILLGVLTYDANMLLVEPRRRRQT